MSEWEAARRIRAASADLSSVGFVIFLWRLVCRLATLVDEDQLDEAIEECVR